MEKKFKPGEVYIVTKDSEFLKKNDIFLILAETDPCHIQSLYFLRRSSKIKKEYFHIGNLFWYKQL